MNSVLVLHIIFVLRIMSICVSGGSRTSGSQHNARALGVGEDAGQSPKAYGALLLIACEASTKTTTSTTTMRLVCSRLLMHAQCASVHDPENAQPTTRFQIGVMHFILIEVLMLFVRGGGDGCMLPAARDVACCRLRPACTKI